MIMKMLIIKVNLFHKALFSLDISMGSNAHWENGNEGSVLADSTKPRGYRKANAKQSITELHQMTG